MINITKCKLEQLIGEDRCCIGESKERVVCEDSSQTHGARMEDSFSTEATQTSMAMDNINLLSDDDIAEYWEKGEDGGECRFAVDDKEGNVVDLQSIGEITHTRTALISMGNNDDFVTPIDEFLRSN